jgi:hypothetical protein
MILRRFGALLTSVWGRITGPRIVAVTWLTFWRKYRFPDGVCTQRRAHLTDSNRQSSVTYA